MKKERAGVEAAIRVLAASAGVRTVPVKGGSRTSGEGKAEVAGLSHRATPAVNRINCSQGGAASERKVK